MTQALAYIIEELVPPAIGIIVGWLLNALKNKTMELRRESRKEDEDRRLMRAIVGELLLYRLQDCYMRFVVQRVKCTPQDKEQVETIYRYYHDELGLNGPGTNMYEKIIELP